VRMVPVMAIASQTFSFVSQRSNRNPLHEIA
jgi:hypothetical protein